jgi:uncharacterized protein DUF4019
MTIPKTCSVLIGAAILFTLLSNVAAAANDDKTAAALAAADNWLALVDGGNYGDSWKEASPRLQAGATQQKWEEGLHAAREPEGKIISRKVKKSHYQSTPPGRESVMIWYETSFQNRESADERLWTRLDDDGRWRVTGYLITASSPDLRNRLMALLLFLVIIGVWFMELRPRREAPER